MTESKPHTRVVEVATKEANKEVVVVIKVAAKTESQTEVAPKEKGAVEASIRIMASRGTLAAATTLRKVARQNQAKAFSASGRTTGLERIQGVLLTALISMSKGSAPEARPAHTLTSALSCPKQGTYATNWVTLRISANKKIAEPPLRLLRKLEAPCRLLVQPLQVMLLGRAQHPLLGTLPSPLARGPGPLQPGWLALLVIGLLRAVSEP